MAMEIKEYVGHQPTSVKEQKQPAVKKPAKKSTNKNKK